MRIRHLSFLVFLFAACVVGSFLACRSAASAATAAGVAITNVASFTYTDTAGSFIGTSNTLTIYVQNVPTLTVVNSSTQSITPSMVVIDTFTLTNTGNGTLATNVFVLDGVGSAFTGTGSPTLLGYVLAAAPTGTCSVATPCPLMTTLNGLAGMTGVGPISVGVEYQLASTATVGQTVITTLHAQITYAAVNGQSAATSLDTTGVETDTSVVDARLDVQTSKVDPTSGVANIAWTVKANNGGGSPAVNLLAARAALNSLPAAAGVVLFVPTPTFSSVPLGMTGPPTLTPGTLSAGAAAAMYYNTALCTTSPTTGWTAAYASAAGCMAVYVSGGTTGGQELPAVPSGSSGAGAVTNPQITLSFTTLPPSAAGGGNPNSVGVISTGAVGGVVWATGVTPILGQGVAMGTVAAQDAATASLLNNIQANLTPSTGIIAPGGASNLSQSQAYSSYSIFIGPFGSPTATGAWSAGTFGFTSGSSTNLTDFTFVDTGPLASTNLGTNPAIAPLGATGLTVPGTVTIQGTVQNAGNITDSANLTVSTVGSWTVVFYCLNPAGSVTCPGGSNGSCYTTAAITNTGPILGQATYGFCAKFTPGGTVTGLAPLDWTITATSAGSGGVSNATHDVLFPGGVLVAFRSAAVTGTGCSLTTLLPGCTITYSVTLVNEAPIPTASSGVGNLSVSVPAGAAVTENGAINGNTWGANTAGLTAAPNISACVGCTLATAGLGSKLFTVTLPILAPQATVTYTYAVIVN